MKIGTLDLGAVTNHLLDSLLRYVGGHAIVDAAVNCQNMSIEKQKIYLKYYE